MKRKNRKKSRAEQSNAQWNERVEAAAGVVGLKHLAVFLMIAGGGRLLAY